MAPLALKNRTDRCSELMLMATYDMDHYFCGDVEKWMQCVSDRLHTYAKQYVDSIIP